jgi:hypothetical protein
VTDREPSATTLRTHAFGIEVESSFEVPGLAEAQSTSPLPCTRLTRLSEDELNEAWRPRQPERLLEETFDGSPAARTIDRDPELGYRLYAKHFGLASISADGGYVRCAPPDVSPWRWQRFLVGRVLPWASLLQGRELIHASAVRLGDRVVAMVAPSGSGKSSLALRMVLRGAAFFTDDVLALSRGEANVMAHPGAGIVAVRPAEKELLDRSDLRRLGRVLGTSGKTYVSVAREEAPCPLGAVYFLTPRRASAEPIEPGAAPRQLLGSAFISSVTSPQRLSGLLDLCAELSRTTPLFQLGVDMSIGADALAESVLDHAADAIAEHA